MPHFEQKKSTQEIFQGNVFRVTVDSVVLENGNTSTREVVHHNGGACVAAITSEKEVYMVKQFRYPFQQEMWELPAGKLEPNENPFEAAKRELEEEAGVKANRYFDLGVVYPTVGYCTEKIYMWAATDLQTTKQHLDQDEFLSVYKIPLKQAVEMVMNGEICDSKTAVALLKLEKAIENKTILL